MEFCRRVSALERTAFLPRFIHTQFLARPNLDDQKSVNQGVGVESLQRWAPLLRALVPHRSGSQLEHRRS